MSAEKAPPQRPAKTGVKVQSDRRLERHQAKRAHVKAVAQRLFAENGLNRVTTRDIVEAAGQRNVALVNYYFGSRAALVSELISDLLAAGAADRKRRIEALKDRAEPMTVRDVLQVLLAQPVLENAEQSQYYGRFIAMLLIYHRDALIEATGQKIDAGSRLCLEELRRLMPDMPRHEMRNRINLSMLLFVSAQATHETAGPYAGRDDAPFVIDPDQEQLIDAAEAILMQPVRPKREAALAAAREHQPLDKT